MNKLTVIIEVPPIILEIVSFVNDNAGSTSFESKTEHFVLDKIMALHTNKSQKLRLIKNLEQFPVYDLSLYNRDEIEDSVLLRLIMFLSFVKGSLLEGLTSESGESSSKSSWKIERQISPPLSAYRDKANITYSNKSYGLLFE
jgi:hypothetical protein